MCSVIIHCHVLMSSKLLEWKFLFWGCKKDVNQITCNLSLFSFSASFSNYINAYCFTNLLFMDKMVILSAIWIKIKNKIFLSNIHYFKCSVVCTIHKNRWKIILNHNCVPWLYVALYSSHQQLWNVYSFHQQYLSKSSALRL